MSFAATTLRMGSGVLVWAAHFLVIYATTGIVCARLKSEWIERTPWMIGAATLIACAVLAAIIFSELRRRPREELSRFIGWTTIALALLALIAVLWETVPVLIVPVCG